MDPLTFLALTGFPAPWVEIMRSALCNASPTKSLLYFFNKLDTDFVFNCLKLMTTLLDLTLLAAAPFFFNTNWNPFLLLMTETGLLVEEYLKELAFKRLDGSLEKTRLFLFNWNELLFLVNSQSKSELIIFAKILARFFVNLMVGNLLGQSKLRFNRFNHWSQS